MLKHRFSLFALLAMLAAMPSAAHGQDPGLQPLREEYAEVADRLHALELRVLEDPTLRRINERLGVEMLTAMERADPELAALMRSVPDLEAKAREAEASGDSRALGTLTEEIRRIRERYVQAQSAALADAELEEKVRFFHALVRRMMIRADPRADSLLTRFRILAGQLGLPEPG